MYSNKTILETLVFLSLASPQAYGAITYNVVPREGQSAFWSLDRGTITTDGTIGDISPQNFESWELQFSSPSGESIISSDNGTANLVVSTSTDLGSRTEAIAPSLIANQDHIIASLGTNGLLFLAFSDQDIFSAEFAGKGIAFFPSNSGVIDNGGGGGGGSLIDNTVDSLYPIGLFNSGTSPNQSSFLAAPGPLLIGFVDLVPEPSNLVLILTTFLCRCFLRRVQRIVQKE